MNAKKSESEDERKVKSEKRSVGGHWAPLEEVRQ